MYLFGHTIKVSQYKIGLGNEQKVMYVSFSGSFANLRSN